MPSRQRDRHRWRRPAVLLSLVVATIALVEILAIYVVLPGRAPTTFTALQPDSISYICHGLQLSWLDEARSSELSSALFDRFGYPSDSCARIDPIMPWQVIARPLLPGLIAVTSGLVQFPWAALLPSVAVFAGLVALWLLIVVPRNGRPGITTWMAAIAPFAAITMILWPASVLTEGPVLGFSLAAVLLIAQRRRLEGLNAVTFTASLAIIGALLLITRPSWPLVGAMWSAGLVMLALEHWKPRRVTALLTVLSGLVAGYGVAIVLARVIDLVLVPPGLKESQKYVPEGLSASDLPEIAWSSITSTANDIVIAIMQGDVVSPVLLIAGLVALILLFRRRAWALAWVCTISWALGFYAVGLVKVFDDASRTHLRFLVPATLMSIAAVLLVDRLKHSANSTTAVGSSTPQET